MELAEGTRTRRGCVTVQGGYGAGRMVTVIRVPATALIAGAQGTEVAVLGSDNKVQLKRVEIGRDFGDRAKLVAGVSRGDRVIDSPLETLSTGDSVRPYLAEALSKCKLAGATLVIVKFDRLSSKSSHVSFVLLHRFCKLFEVGGRFGQFGFLFEDAHVV
jgi:hypothetical protein